MLPITAIATSKLEVFPLPLGSGFWGELQKTSLAGELQWRCNFPFIDSFFSHGSEKLCYGHGFFHTSS